MTGSTTVHRALECLEAEREAIADRKSAFDAFARRVRSIPTAEPAPARTGGVAPATPKAMATAVQQPSAQSPAGDRCATVREAFAETVGPHSIASADASPVRTIAAELSDEIAVALEAETGWTPTLKRNTLETVATQQRKAELLEETLRRERRALEAAVDDVDELVEWLRATDDESLLQCDFDDLQEKHERLEAYRDRLETRIEKRQATFTEPTDRSGPAGPRYRSLVATIYSELSVRYPILSTAIRLDGICADCQRTVRAHLTRRV